MQQSYLIFNLDDELFAVNVNNVTEVIETEEITNVPETAPYIKGITNFRGNILPAIDMRKKFNMKENPFYTDSVLIVINLTINEKNVELGAIVDAVSNVIEVNLTEIAKLPEIGTKYNTKFIEGIIAVKNDFIVLLDIEKIFSVDEITIITEAGSKEHEKAE